LEGANYRHKGGKGDIASWQGQAEQEGESEVRGPALNAVGREADLFRRAACADERGGGVAVGDDPREGDGEAD